MSVLKRVAKCDICGKYDCDLDGRLKIKQRQSLWDETWMTRFDICPECSRSMREWIRMKKEPKSEPSNSQNSRIVGVTREAVLRELHAQIAVGNMDESVAGDIMLHLFKED